MTLDETFQKHMQTWKTHTKFESSYTKICEHPSYKAIIKMGKPVIPLIINELRREQDHWFVALHTITGESPIINNQYASSVKELTQLWLNWADRNNY